MSLITARDLIKNYVSGETEVKALRELSFTIDRGAFVSFIGPSGSGKTTLLNLIGLLDKPTGGFLSVAGTEVGPITRKEAARFRGKHIGFIFQNFNLIDSYTVAKNVELPLLYSGVPAKDRKKMVQETLEYVELEHRGGHKPNQLSGGQQQRVAVARALVKAPKIIFADEPTGNLDSSSGLIVMDMLKRFNEEQGTTVIMVSHSEEFAKYGHRILHLFDGSIVSESDPKFYT